MIAQYGTQKIIFHHKIDPNLTHAYITVDFNEGVILKSPPLDPAHAEALVREKGAWILQKLKLVTHETQNDIVTGSRSRYLGKRYYTTVIRDNETTGAKVVFNYSSFRIFINPSLPHPHEEIIRAFDRFYRNKAAEKITPRVQYWSRITGFQPTGLKFRKLNKRWGSCTRRKEIIINIHAVKLPLSLIDYIIVHELCHLLHNTHSKAFQREVEKYLPTFRDLENQLSLIQY
jgi:predicted metal-dependent hydrolase